MGDFGPLELKIPVSVPGMAEFEKLGTTTDSQTDRTKRLSAALQDYLAKQQNVISAQKTYAEQQAKTAELTEKYWDQQTAAMRRMNTAHEAAIKEQAKREEDLAKKRESANQAQADSIQRWITNPMAAAGDAAKNFALRFGEAGIQAVGAVVGVAALGAAIFKLTSEVSQYAREQSNLAASTGMSVGEVQKFSRMAEIAGVPVTGLMRAVRQMSQAMADGGEEGKKQQKALRELGVDYQKFGDDVGSLFEETARKLQAMPQGGEKNWIAQVLGFGGRGGAGSIMPVINQFSDLEQKIHGVMTDADIQRATLYAQKVSELGQWVDQLKQKLAMPFILDITFRDGPALGLLRKLGFGYPTSNVPTNDPHAIGYAGSGAKSAGGYPDYLVTDSAANDTIEIPVTKSNADLRAAALAASATATQARIKQLLATEAQRGGRDSQIGQLQAHLSTIPSYESLSADAVRRDVSKDVQDRQQTEAKIRGIQAAVKAEEKLAEARKQATAWTERAKEAEDKAGNRTPLERRMGEYTAIEDQRKARMAELQKTFPGGVPADLQQSATNAALMEQAGSIKKYNEAIAKATDEINKLYSKMQFDVTEEAKQGLTKNLKDFSIDHPLISRMLEDATPTAPYIPGMDTQDRIKRLQIASGAQLKFAQMRTATEGGRIGLSQSMDDEEAKKVYDLQKQYNDTVLEGQNRQRANEKALEELQDRRYSNAIKYEEQMADLRLKQEQEFASKGVELFHALTTGHGASFVRGQAVHMGDTVMSNFLQQYIAPTALKMIPQAGEGFLGNLLKGTPFAMGRDDPAMAAKDNAEKIKENSDKTAFNTSSMDQLNAQIATMVSLFGGTPSNVPTDASANLSPLSTALGGPATLAGAVIGTLGLGSAGLGGTAGALGATASNLTGGPTSMIGSILKSVGLGGSPSTGASGSSALSAIAGLFVGGPSGTVQAGAQAQTDAIINGIVTNPLGSPVAMPGMPDLSSSPYGLSWPGTDIDGGWGAQALPGMPDISGSSPWNANNMGPASSPSGVAAAAGLTASASSGMSKTSGEFASGVKDPIGVLFGQGGTYSPNTAQTAGAIVGLAGAGFGAFKGISEMTKGGAQNIAGGLGTTLMSVAPLTGPAAPFVMAAGLLSDVVSAAFGDPRANRAKDISKKLQYSQFMAPEALNVTMDTSGNYADYSSSGQARGSDLSPWPIVQQPYYDPSHSTWVPGRIISQFGGPSGITSSPAPTVNIAALDSQSFHDAMTRNSDMLEDVMTHVASKASGPFLGTLRNQLGSA